MNNGDCSRDEMAVSWSSSNLTAGNRGTYSGKWAYWGVNGFDSRYTEALDIRKTEQTAGVGVAWDFHEWKPWFDGNGCQDYVWRAWWGRASTILRETTWQNRYMDVVGKYYHTYPSAVTTYTIGYPSGGSISISPTTSQWAAILAVDFTV